jgi:hypothetical protein
MIKDMVYCIILKTLMVTPLNLNIEVYHIISVSNYIIDVHVSLLDMINGCYLFSIKAADKTRRTRKNCLLDNPEAIL